MSILYIKYIYNVAMEYAMDIVISNASGKPIYEQITGQIKGMILSGVLLEGDALPSMRLLAKELRISVITTKRAYEELEREGFLYTVPGKGCFVAPMNVELLREENLKKIEGHFSQILSLAASCNLSKADLQEMLECAWEETL